MGIHIHACDFSGTGFLLVMLSAILPMLGISYLLMGLVLQLPKLKKVLSALFGIWLIIAIFAVVIVARGQYMPGDSNDSQPQIPISQHDTIRVETIRHRRFDRYRYGPYRIFYRTLKLLNHGNHQ